MDTDLKRKIFDMVIYGKSHCHFCENEGIALWDIQFGTENRQVCKECLNELKEAREGIELENNQ